MSERHGVVARTDPQMIDVGGRRLALWSAGRGAPAVVLEMGLGSSGRRYERIARELARETQVAWYDRAGVGQSDAAPTPRTVLDLVGDLHALLQAARISGPYILAGHSLSGLTVRFYQHRYPGEVAALVLIDSAHEEQRARLAALLPPEAADEHGDLAQSRRNLMVNWNDPAMNDERIDNAANSDLMRGCGDLADLPLVVISRGRASATSMGFPPGLGESQERAWRQMQRELAGLSSNSVHLIAERSGHLINEDEPEVIIAGIRRAIEMVRQRRSY